MPARREVVGDRARHSQFLASVAVLRAAAQTLDLSYKRGGAKVDESRAHSPRRLRQQRVRLARRRARSHEPVGGGHWLVETRPPVSPGAIVWRPLSTLSTAATALEARSLHGGRSALSKQTSPVPRAAGADRATHMAPSRGCDGRGGRPYPAGALRPNTAGGVWARAGCVGQRRLSGWAGASNWRRCLSSQPAAHLSTHPTTPRAHIQPTDPPPRLRSLSPSLPHSPPPSPLFLTCLLHPSIPPSLFSPCFRPRG